MTKKELADLRSCTGEGHPVIFTTKGTGKKYSVGRVHGVVGVMDHDYHHLLQRIEVDPELRKEFGSLMFRSCYYTLGAASRKPVFGQYHPAVPERAFRALMRKAAERGWFTS